MKKIQLLMAVVFVAGAADLFAGKTFRNTAEDTKARERALKAYHNTNSKKEANRAGAKPKKKSAAVDVVVNVAVATATQAKNA